MPTDEPRLGYQLGLDFALPRGAPPAGYAIGLEFVRGPLPPRPDPSALRPGGSLPAPVVGFGGQLRASYLGRDATVQPGGVLSLSAVGISGSLVGAYDSRVQRPLAGACAAPCQDAQHLGASPLAGMFDRARQAALRVRVVAQQAQTTAAHTQGRSQQTQPLDARVQSRGQQAQPLRHVGMSAFEGARHLRRAVHDRTQQARRLPMATLAYAWQIADWGHRQHLERYEQAGIQRHMGLRAPPVLPAPIGWPGWRIALEFAPQFAVPRTWGELQTGGLVSTNGLADHVARPASSGRYQDAQKPGPALVKAPWPPEVGGGEEPEEPPGPPATIVLARRRTYIVINSIEVRRVDTDQVLPALDSGFSMQLERGSWSWGFTVNFHASALPLLQPDGDGLPVMLQVTVNGQPFRMLAERIARSVQFPRAVVQVQGGGPSVLLDAPYAPHQSFMQPDLSSAEQLMLDVLKINGVSMGWSVDWQLTDWTLPAGTWAHQGTWISAINDIAGSVGAYVQPHDTAQTLHILPAWPVRAWEMAGASPDIELPPGIAAVEEIEWVTKPAYDSLYMRGEPGTYNFFRRRTGTPGVVHAPQVVHPLLVDAAAAAQRAIAELSDTGRQVEQQLQLMVHPETGVIKPGRLIRYTDDAAVQRTGVTRAVFVQMDGPRLTQTIRVQAPEVA